MGDRGLEPLTSCVSSRRSKGISCVFRGFWVTISPSDPPICNLTCNPGNFHMSRLYKMTWEKSKQRWRKMYQGRIYTVSPQTLGCPPTKDESYQAANGWWEAKLTEIKGQPSTRFDHLVEELEALRDTGYLLRGYDYLINYVRRSAL